MDISRTRLISFEVDGLFGLYDHRIKFNTDPNVTVIIGPNGRGKTVCFRLIDALFRRQHSVFVETLFQEIRFTFSNHQVIRVVSNRLDADRPDRRKQRPGVTLVLSGNDVPEAISINLTEQDDDAEDSILASSFLRNDKQVFRFREIAALKELYENSPTAVSDLLLHRFHLGRTKASEPPALRALLDSMECRLVETQRLLDIRSGKDDDHHKAGRTTLVVEQKGRTLRDIMRNAIAKYAAKSQDLDRTFPLRVINKAGRALTRDQVLSRLGSLDDKRKALMSVGILDRDSDPFGGRIVDTAASAETYRLLGVYVTDNEDKLSEFDRLLAQLNVFQELISSRFNDKAITFDTTHGFLFKSSKGLPVPVDKLSSGEQHYLILMFSLIFEAKENTLLLIDEPELSMHVAWQKSFIDGLLAVLRLTPFDAVLATHSASLISRHIDLIVDLGNVDGDK